MEELYRSIGTNRYPIACKLCVPDGEVRGAILSAHGFASSKDSATQKAVVRAGTRHGLSVLCFDFPAHGESEVGEDRLTVENCRQDLLVLADFLRLLHPNVPRYLFASSFGGYTALLCEDLLPDFRMVLRAPAVTMGEHVLLDLLQTTEEAFRQRRTIPFGSGRVLHVPFRFYEQLRNRTVTDRTFDQPFLIVQGDKDEVVPYEDVVRFCSAHPTAQLRVLPGAGHAFTQEETDEALRYAIQFWTGETDA